MPATVTAPLLTSDEILFASKADANTFFQGFTVPNANATDYGVVLQAIATAFAPTQVTQANIIFNAYTVVLPDSSTVTIQVPESTHYAFVCAEILKLQVALTALITNLSNAGIAAP